MRCVLFERQKPTDLVPQRRVRKLTTIGVGLYLLQLLCPTYDYKVDFVYYCESLFKHLELLQNVWFRAVTTLLDIINCEDFLL